MKKLYLVVNVDWFFLSHRLPIALEAKQRGYDVTVFAIPEGDKGDEIRSHGLNFIPLPTSRSGMNFIRELNVVFFLFRHFLKGKPDVVHNVAVKPVTYGSIAAKLVKVPKVINALSGLGFLFINSNTNKFVHRLVHSMFKFAFKNPRLRFILQNHDDFDMIKKIKVLEANQIFLIKGSGVDLNEFSYSIESGEQIQIVLPSRMLWDKGVGEYVKAAKILNEEFGDKVKFILAGPVDMGNKAGIKKEKLLEWSNDGYVNWIGNQTDMVGLLRTSHIVVLPSYREGLPKSLIEACAIGRPIVTTDVPGCREVVVDGYNGYLAKVKDVKSLADGIRKLIIDENLRIQMGKNGRRLAEEEFSLDSVVAETFKIYNS